MSLDEKIMFIISKNIEKKQDISLEMELVNDLGMDSLAVMMVTQALEDEFAISIDDADFKNLKTVRDVVEKLRATFPSLAGEK